MKELIIQAQNGAVLKEYKNEDIYILECDSNTKYLLEC